MKKLILPLVGTVLIAAGCIKVDSSLGKGLVDKSLLYESYTVEFPLTEIMMKKSSDLSGYSSTRIALGAVRDDDFGLASHESAFPLVPALDTLDLGDNPTAVSFDVYFAADTVSCPDDSQARILQNFYVHELTARLPDTNVGTSSDIPHSAELITDGLPVYNGSGPLNFAFTKAFAQKYVDGLKALAPDGVIVNREWDDDTIAARYDDYVDALPGIYISCDAPAGNGGRINLFGLSCLSLYSGQYYINSNTAVLKVNSTWNGVQKDSSFLFIPGEMAFADEITALEDNTGFSQYAFNHTTHSTVEGKPTDRILVEGGGGLKPVISALELQQKTNAAIAAKGGAPDNTIVTKATIVLPYEMPANYEDMKYFPSLLSPTIRLTVTDEDDGSTSIQFAGLTDASVSTENQGDIDRSNLVYSPDISYHLQEILKRDDLDTSTDADIWLLTIFSEKVATATDNALNQYYQQMMYAMYYNSIYGGGYGGYGYGSYGGYGYNSYSNYYTYAMLAQYYNQYSQQQYTTTTELDKDRYYHGVLSGPDATRAPYFRVTFAICKE